MSDQTPVGRYPIKSTGATTSRVHTALKIAPRYPNAVVHVQDASRAVGVAGSLLSHNLRESFEAGIRDEYEDIRRARAGRDSGDRLGTLAEARAARFVPAADVAIVS